MPGFFIKRKREQDSGETERETEHSWKRGIASAIKYTIRVKHL